MRSKLASSIAILLNYGAKWRALYYIFYVLCLDLELSILLNGRYLYSDIENIRSKTDGHSVNLTEKSLFSFIMNIVDIGNIDYSFASLLIIGIIYTAIALLAYLSVCFHLPNTKILTNRFGRQLIVFIFMGSSFFMLYFMNNLYSALKCREYVIQTTSESVVSDVTGKFLSTFFNNQSRKVKYGTVRRPDISQDFECYGPNHIGALFAFSVITVLTILIKITYGKLVSQMYSSKMLTERFHVGWFHVGLLGALIIVKTIVFILTGSEMDQDTLLLFSLCIIGLVYIIYLFIRPYHDERINSMESIHQVILFFTIICVMGERALIVGASTIKNSSVLVIEALAFAFFVRLTFILRKTLSRLKLHFRGKQLFKDELEKIVIESFSYIENILVTKDPIKLKVTYASKLFDCLLVFKTCMPDQLRLINKISDALQNYYESQTFFSQPPSQPDQQAAIPKTPNDFSFWEQENYPPEPPLLESIEELPEREVSSVIKLLDVFLSTYFKIDVIPNSNTPRLMLACFFNFNTTYMSKPLLAVHTLRRAVKNGLANDLNVDVLQEFVELRIKEALHSSNFFMANNRAGLSFKQPQINKVVFSTMMTCLNDFAVIKFNIVKMLQLRIDNMKDSVHARTFKTELLYKTAAKYRILRDESEKLFESIKAVVGEFGSVPLLMVEAFYRVHLTHDTHRGMIIANGMKQTTFKYGLKQMTEVEFVEKGEVFRSYTDKTVVVAASAEPDNFHTILSVTSNITLRLGFPVEELIGKDLSIIIPEPFKTHHREFSMPEASTGAILEAKTEHELFVSTRQKTVHSIKLAVRIAVNRNSGVIMVGKINFNVPSKAQHFFIMNQDSKISEVSHEASPYFQRGDSLLIYSPELLNLANAFVRGSTLKEESSDVGLLRGVLDPNSSSQYDMRSYIALRKGIEVNISDKKGRSIVLHMKFKELMIRALNRFIYIVNFQIDTVGIEQNFKGMYAIHADSERKIRPERQGRLMPTTFSSIRVIQTQTTKEDNHLSQTTSFNQFETMGNILKSPRDALLYVIAEGAESILSEMEKAPRALAIQKLTSLFNKRSLKSAISLIIQRSIATKKLLQLQEAQIKTQRKRVFRPTVKEDLFNDLGSQLDMASSHSSKYYRLDMTLKKEINERSIKRNMILSSVLIVAIYVVATIVAHFFYSNSIILYTDLGLKAKSMDTASWALWAVNSFQSIVDISRAALDGLIPVNHFEEFGVPDILSYANDQKVNFQDLILLYSRNAMMELEAKDYQLNWNNEMMIKLPAYLGSEESRLALVPEIQSLTMLQPFINSYIARDDTAAWTATRDSEEVVRYNLLNGLQQMTYDLSAATDAYLMLKTEAIYRTMVLLSVGQIFLVLVTIFVFFASLTSLRLKAVTLFRGIVNFRNADVKISLNVLERHLKSFNFIATNELKAFQEGIGKYLNIKPKSEDLNISNWASTEDSKNVKLRFEYDKVDLKSNHHLRDSNSRINLSRDRYTFGFFRLINRLILVCIPWVAVTQWTLYNDIRHANQMRNLMGLYDLMVLSWNTHSSIEVILVSQLINGDRATVLYDKPAEAFEKMYTYYIEQMIPRFQEFRSQDLGEYKDIYLEAMRDDNSLCTSLMTKSDVYYAKCGTGTLAFIDSGVIPVLRKVSSMMSSTQELLKRNANNSTGSPHLLDNPDIKTYLFYCGVLESSSIGVMLEIYYRIMENLAPAIDNQVNQKRSPSHRAHLLTIAIPMLIYLILALFMFVFIPLIRFPRDCSNVLMLFDSLLLETNMWLMNRIKYRKNK